MISSDMGEVVYPIQDMGTETNIQAVDFMEALLGNHYVAVCYGG